MTANKAIAKLLKLHKILKVSDLQYRRDGSLSLSVKPYKNGARCPDCGRRGKIVRTRPVARQWRDLPVAGREVTLVYFPREIVCATHGRCEEEIPWSAPHARITTRLEYAILRLCQTMTQKAAAELLRLSASTLSEQLHRSVTRRRAGHRIRRLRVIGIDEISYHKRHRYATLVYDLERSVVVWVGQGRGRETIDRFFNEMLSPYQRAQIHTACCDMSEAYMGAIRDHCRNAELVLDRFHIVKALNEAVDEVRKEQWRQADTGERKALKGLRWLLYRHSSTRSPANTRTLRALEKHNRRIYRAWRLKDEFEQLWEYKARWAAERFFKRWTTAALRSRLEPLRQFVYTARRYQKGILAFVTSRVTNAVAEGINRIVKIVKNRASGFRSLDAFTDLIYLTVGDLEIPGQIPTKFRAL
jgi:transposase